MEHGDRELQKGVKGLDVCELQIRGRLVERANAQIGWWGRNRKSLEPENIAPTWVHYDVRSYDRTYLRSDYFCSDLQSLDGSLPVEL